MARGTVPTANYLGRKSLRTVVILAEKAMYPILASPTTEPGRRGWSWQRGSPTSALSLCPKRHVMPPTRSCGHNPDSELKYRSESLRLSIASQRNQRDTVCFPNTLRHGGDDPPSCHH